VTKSNDSSTRSLNRTVTMDVNGRRYTRAVSTRKTLADFIREDLGLTGTHLGCEHGVCGACTVSLDDTIVRSCLMFAMQCDGRAVTTIEGVGADQLNVVPRVLGPPRLAVRVLHTRHGVDGDGRSEAQSDAERSRSKGGIER
jgi:hypothetical protein